MQNILVQVQKVLRSDNRLVSEDGVLLKNKIHELINANDTKILDLLLSDKIINAHFTFSTKSALIFDKDKFIRFLLSKNFLPDSYTSFKNKIGLTSEDEYISDTKKVTLVWPYKDCVIEGEMRKEGEDRAEVFYNETIAPDDIDRLTDPKVFTNFVKVEKSGIQKITKLEKNSAGGIKDNLIIKGNNLLALHSLKKVYSEQVKLIYIDPPYNRDADTFYNDSFRHSSWLTFMKNRLEVARELLSPEGSIFVSCDDVEASYLRVLMDEIFDVDCFVGTIVVLNNPRGRDYGTIANTHEYIHAYTKSPGNDLNLLTIKDKKFPYEDSKGGFENRELRNRNIRFNSGNRPNLLYPFYVDPNSEDEYGFCQVSLEEKRGWVKTLPRKSQGIQTVWRWGREKSEKNLQINLCARKMREGTWMIIEKYRGTEKRARSVWQGKEFIYDKATLHLKELFGKKVFDYAKPEFLLKTIIEIGTKPGELVLDFFLGSGTTCAVAHKMQRQYIGIEQMDYVEDVTTKRLQKVIQGEQGEISQEVDWKGGGTFIFCELMRWNENWVEKINKAKTQKEVIELWNSLKKSPFLSYKVEPSKIDESVDDFNKLSFLDQKKFLIEVLDKNQLYVNFSEIDDTEYKVSKADKELNNSFYVK